MKVDDTVKVVKGGHKGMVGKVTKIFDGGHIDVYFKELERRMQIPYTHILFFDESYLEVINESL